MARALGLSLLASTLVAGIPWSSTTALAAPAKRFDETVDQVVASAIAAQGGEANLRAIQSLRIISKASFGGGDFKVEAHAASLMARPGLSRSEFSLQGMTQVSAFDGRETWSMSPFQGRRDAEKGSADDARSAAEGADIDGPLLDWRKKGHKVRLLGLDDMDGTEAIKLHVELKGGNEQYIYLDPESRLTLRVTSTTKSRGVERVSETDFGDYRQVAGVWMPFAIESGGKGGPKGFKAQVQTVEVNVPVDASWFVFPPAGTRIDGVIVADAGAKPTPAPAAPPTAAASAVAVYDSATISGIGARNIGSAAMSGRISALAARHHKGKTTIYAGAASGGLWKSPDGGTTFEPVFDDNPVQSIGAVTIDPSDAETIWVGTGEPWTRNSVSVGNGVYRSTDGGATWEHKGLDDSERVAKIVVHPSDRNTVYVCAPGKLWSDSPQRGVYRTSDGGGTWHAVLQGPNLSTGCSGLAMHPKQSKEMFAGTWDFRRKGWTFRSGGEGPEAFSGSGLFHTLDGGHTWASLEPETHPGLPAKPWGRVEVTYAPSKPSIVYALIESTDTALYRSEDGGRTWQARDKSQSMVWRPFYFARLIVDPTNPERLFKPNLDLIVSEDGGRSFSSSGGGAHGDWHDLWINPSDPKHVIGGDDGGLWISRDGGSRWNKTDNLPISQFYHVSVDNADPYRVYGGLQDNGSWVAESRYPGGISNARWQFLSGGDGFHVEVDPTDPEAVYAEYQGGFVSRVDRATRSSRDIQPTAGYGEKLRFSWDAPIHISPNRKDTLYIAAQYLFRSRNRGQSWERISPDLTTNDPEKQKQELSGGITVDNSSAEMHTTITAVAESPKSGQTIWVGTDDGNLQLTRNGGKSWTNVVGNVTGLPPHSWVSSVAPSRHAAGTAYATFDRHTFGDMQPWVYRTTDFGKTWTRIVSPSQGVRGYAHVVAEDPVNAELLYVGTEFGLWISVDGGAQWAQFKGGDFPSVPVRDLRVHGRDHDLVIGTHGRGIWIVDDLTPLRAMSGEVMARQTSLLPDRRTEQTMSGMGDWVMGDNEFVGDDVEGGATISYYLKSRHIYGPINIEILDAKGEVVDTVTPSKRRGLNRVTWSMRLPPPRVPKAAQLAFAGMQGPRVLPGRYTVRLTRGAEVLEQPLEVQLDHRAPYRLADRKAQLKAAMDAHALFGKMSELVMRIDGATMMAGQLVGKDAELDSLLRTTLGELGEVKKKIVATTEGGAITGEIRLREHLDQLYGALLGYEGRPTDYQLARLKVLARELDEVAGEFEKLAAEKLPQLNAELKRRNMPTLSRLGEGGQLDQAGLLAARCYESGGVGCDPVDSLAAD